MGALKLTYRPEEHTPNLRVVYKSDCLNQREPGTTDDKNLRLHYSVFGSLMPGRSFNAGDYRFAYQSQESDDEIFGSHSSFLSFKYRGYDSRTGRFWSVDPLAAKYPYNSTYAFQENKLGLGREFEGLELVYDRAGTYMGSVGENKDMYVMSQYDYIQGTNQYTGDDAGLSQYVMDKGIRAYGSEKEAAKAWAPEGHSATRTDNLERAASIFTAKAKGGPVENLYVLGNTVTGQNSNDPTVTGEVDPFKSSAVVGGKNLLDMKYGVSKTGTRKKYGTDFSTPGWVAVAGLFGYENKESYQYTAKASYWKRSGFIHTHIPRDNKGNWSLSGGGMGYGYSGDIGLAMDGYNVYLGLTNSETIKEIILIKAVDFQNVGYFQTQKRAQDYARQYQIRIPLNK